MRTNISSGKLTLPKVVFHSNTSVFKRFDRIRPCSVGRNTCDNFLMSKVGRPDLHAAEKVVHPCTERNTIKVYHRTRQISGMRKAEVLMPTLTINYLSTGFNTG